jgi:hypothetical protein
MAQVAAADFSVSYRAKSASLVLFEQPQPSPFAAVGARLCIKGDRVRVEATDHWGRTHVWISDRTSHETWRLLADQRYSTESGGWSCQGLPVQLATVIAASLQSAGIDSLSISGPTAGAWQEAPARVTQWTFRARVFGAPRPVWVRAEVYFPTQEQAHFGAGVSELYCGKPPAEPAWRSAFEQFLDLSKEGCGTLAGVIALPLAMEFKSDLGGMGAATLVVEATGASDAALDKSLFRIPAGYRPVSPSE